MTYAGVSQWSEGVAMCVGSDDGMRFSDLLRDPLIRLVTESDGVTEQKMVAVMYQLCRALAARDIACAPNVPVRRWGTSGCEPPDQP